MSRTSESMHLNKSASHGRAIPIAVDVDTATKLPKRNCLACIHHNRDSNRHQIRRHCLCILQAGNCLEHTKQLYCNPFRRTSRTIQEQSVASAKTTRVHNKPLYSFSLSCHMRTTSCNYKPKHRCSNTNSSVRGKSALRRYHVLGTWEYPYVAQIALQE